MASYTAEIVGRSGTNSGFSRVYRISGVDTESDCLTAVLAEAPTTIGSFHRDVPSVGFTELDDQIYEATVPYVGDDEPETGEWSYEFNFQAPAEHIRTSLATVWRSNPSRDFGGAINVVDEGGGQRVEGLALASPPETFRISFVLAAASFTSDYQNIVENLCGTVNATAWNDRPAGSLLLSRAAGGLSSDGTARLDFGFSYLPNQSANLNIGGITVPAGTKQGHHLLWVYYGSDADQAYGGLVKRPQGVYVERVRPYGNFSNLGF